QAQQFQSILDDQMHRTNTGTVTVTDETESVEVTLDGHGWFTGLTIEPGLLRLGAEAVEERVNDALRRAAAAAAATSDADGEQLEASLAEITGALNSIFGIDPNETGAEK